MEGCAETGSTGRIIEGLWSMDNRGKLRQIELFFKWLKQNLCVQHFYGNSLNAVKSQIWIAVCVYLLALIARKQLALELPLQLFLQLVEVNMFEKVSLHQMVRNALPSLDERQLSPQMDLF
jgi:IS4 transposase